MENPLVLKKELKNSGNRGRGVKGNRYQGNVEENLVVGKPGSEVDENFINYLSWHGLEREEDLLILSSTQHYYYDHEELKGVKTLINLKKLNTVSHLEEFLKSLYNNLSPETNFIGCFLDANRDNESLPSRYYRKFLDFIDSRVNVDIDGKDFSRLLEANGFKLMDMTEIDGLTFFRTKNLSRSA